MSEEIKIVGKSEGDDAILKLVSAVDRLEASLGRLASSNTALEKMQRQMKSMQASMTTGFAEMAGAATAGEEKIRKARATGAEKLLQDQVRFEARQHAQANKFHYKQIEAQDTLLVRQRASYAKFWQGVLAEQLKAEAKQAAAQQRRDLEMHNLATKAGNSYVSLWEKLLTQRQQIQERRDTEMHAARTRDNNDYVKFWQTQLATQDSMQAKQLAKAREQQVALHRIQAAEAERARNLNTNFLTATPAVQLRTAQKAQVYTQQGGNAAEKFGSAAANADIAALQRSLAAIPGVADRSRESLLRHNDIMREGHALARGLAGSLGGLWLTYGSLVPLVAGAALAATLKGVVEAGKEVEHQLNFVAALTGQGVNLDQFITITDSSLRSVTEAANAMRALAQNGLDAGQSLQVLPSILQLATVGEMDVGQAAIAVTGAVAAFGLQFTEAERVADIFAKTAATSNTSVLAMTESMKQASTASSLFKVSVEETAGMLGLLAKINITGGAAGTAFTNMLTGLYEPTNQGKKALKELGVEIQTQGGSLKGYTQLMEELRMKLGGFNDAARVDYLGSIFTTRGVKAAELAMQNLDEYKVKVKEAGEASGFMSGVLRKLEDDTEGAFKRLGVAVQNTFITAFAEAAPYVQQLGLHLGDAFKQDGTQSLISNLATNVARLTGFLADNAATVVSLLAAYTGFGMLNGAGGVISMFKAASAATVVSTAATGAATAASLTFNTAQVAGTATTAMYTAALDAQAASTVAATAATRAWHVAVMSALGPVAIALGAAAALWLLLRDNTSEAERVNVQVSNSIHTVTEQLDKEIARLKESNELWDQRNLRFDQKGAVNPEAIKAAWQQVQDIEAALRKKGKDPEKEIQGRMQVSRGGVVSKDFSRDAYDLIEARSNLKKLEDAYNTDAMIAQPGRLVEKTRQSAAQLAQELEGYAKKAKAEDSLGRLVVQNNAARSLMLDKERGAEALMAQLKNPELQLIEPDKEQARIDSIRASLDRLKEDVNGTLSSKPVKEKKDGKGESDRFRAMLQEQQNAAQKAADIAKNTQAQYDSLYKTGEMSAIDYYNSTRDLSIKTAQQRLAAFEKEEAISAMREKRTADVVKFQGKQDQSLREIGEAEVARKRGINEFIYGQDKLRTEREAAEMKKRGDLVAAYERENAPELVKINGNVTAGTSALDKAKAGGNTGEIALAERFLGAARAARTAWDETLSALGQTEAFQKAESAFDLVFAKLNTGLVQLQEKNGEGEGLGAIFSNALAAQELYSSSLDDLMAKQQKLVEIAGRPGATDEQKKAPLDALKHIESAGARLRGIWKNVGSEIEKSLTKAFGNSGKAAGGLINSVIDLGTRRKKMDDDLAKNSAGKDPAEVAKLQQKYAMDAASAQISAYGDMAGAAKGFFDENTKGYAVMEAAERGFRLVELALSAEAMVRKIFMKETEVAANLALNTAKIGGEATATGASVALAGTEASAWGITAVVKALASLPFPANLAAGAATLAAVVAVGASMMGGMGGGSVSLTEERQAKQGTGSVLGDPNAKSESLARALDLIAENTFQDLAISNNMLVSLRAIESGIGKFSAQLVGSNSITGKSLIKDESSGGFFSKIGNSIFGGKTTVEDSGFTLGKLSIADALGGRVNASQYTDTKKSGGWFSIDKKNTNLQALGEDGNRQVSSILTSLYQTVLEAGTQLGLGADEFSTRLNNFVVDIGKVSLKGLSGTEVQEALSAVFSKVGDDLASFGVSGLQQFQKVGEGMLETLVRVASNYQTVSVVMDSLGMSFNSVGMGSIEARERLVDLAGGLDNFKSSAEQFLNDFFTEEERTGALKKRIQPTLDQYGLSTSGADPTKAFKDYVVGLDTTTESGAQAYTALVAISQAFKSIVDLDVTELEKATDLARERRELEIQIMELSGDKVGALAASRALEVADLDKSLQPLQLRIYALQDEAAALELANSVRSQEAQILELMGDKSGALVIQRQLELAGLDPVLRAGALRIYALEDEATALELTNSIRSQEAQILELSGDKTGALAIQRQLELAGLDPVLRAGAVRIHALEDEASALELTNSLLDIQAQIFELTGDKAGAASVLAQQHANALAAMAPELRGATQTLWDLQAAAKATSDASQLILGESTKMAGDVDSAYATLRKIAEAQKSAMQEEISVRTKAIEKTRALSTALRSSLDGMNAKGLEVQDRMVAQAQIAAATALAKASGTLPNVDDLKTALSAVGQDSSSQFATQNDYLRNFYATRKSIEDLADLTDSTLTIEERALASLEAQVKQFDTLLQREQEQIDVLNGISTTGLTMQQALEALRLLMAQSLLNPVTAANSAINDAYKNNLGRAPDATGFEWWKNAAANGAPISEIVNGIANSTEANLKKLYEAYLGRAPDASGLAFWMKAYGSSMDDAETADWLSVTKATDEYKKRTPTFTSVGAAPVTSNPSESGAARIFSTSQTREMVLPVSAPTRSDDSVIIELQMVRKQLEVLQKSNERTAKSTEESAKSNGQLADQFENASGGGNSLNVTVNGTVKTKETA